MSDLTKPLQAKPVVIRLPYHSPALIALGRISALVQAGSMNQPEGMGGQDLMEKL